MAILTVGTGKTYATITLANAAAVAGDVIQVYAGGVANVYTEHVTIAAMIHLIGMLPNHGITIKSDGNYHTVSGNFGFTIENFTLTNAATSNGKYCVSSAVAQCINCVACESTGVNTNGGFSSMPQCFNCLAYGFLGYGFSATTCAHCTSAKCGTGFYNALAGSYSHQGCIGAGNTTDFSATTGAQTARNVSVDATAPGAQAVTGFDTADFSDYAGNVFTLKVSVAATTKARFVGWPMRREDGSTLIRQRASGYWYAGYADPVPCAVHLDGTEYLPTAVVPTGLALTDPGTGGQLQLTFDNAASYRAVSATDTDVIVVYNKSGDAELARMSVFQYNTLGYIPIGGLTTGTTYTMYAKATSDGTNFSAASNTATGTPTNPWAPTVATPTGLVLTNPATGGELRATITNIAAYSAANFLLFFRSTGTLLDFCTVAEYNALGYARIQGLSNGTAYTVVCKASTSQDILSAASGSATSTPTNTAQASSDTFAVDVKDILVAAGYTLGGTGDWGLHIASEPDKPDRCITIYDTGGMGDKPYMSASQHPTEYPSVQVRVRGMTYAEASNKVQAIKELLNAKGGFTSSKGTDYGGIFSSTPISFLKMDTHGRYIFVVNFRTVRE